jgi:hypothetical protein
MDLVNTSRNELETECPSIEIAAYLDGELLPDLELQLEAHLAKCVICTQELNDQKHFINALNSSFFDGPEIPADFTKRIVTNAESGVRGLRQKKERLNAVFVCCALFFFVLFTLGASAPGTIAASLDVFGRIAAVFGFAGHLVYDISIGVVVIMRSLADQPAFGLVAIAVIIPLIVGIVYRFSFLRSGRNRSEYLESGSRI